MLFRSYFDDSSDTDDLIFGVGGFVGQDSAWEQLEPKWLASLPEGIEYFHATDCFSGNGQFQPAKGFDIPDRIALIDKLTDLVCKAEIKLLGHAIDVPYFVQLSPRKFSAGSPCCSSSLSSRH